MVSVWGMGGALPAGTLSNDDLAKMVETSDEWILQRTGISSRRVCKEETSLDLALEASREALDEAGILPDELSLILCATITPDAAVPSVASKLGAALNVTCACMDISAACSGFVYALHTASRLFEGKPVLVVGVERLSSITDYTDRGTCILFGDGAGAAVLGAARGGGELHATWLATQPDVKGSLCANDGVSPYIRMDGREVFRFSTRALAASVENVLQKAGKTKEEVAWFVPHQANARIISAAADMLGVPGEKFFVNIGELGNTSAASVPLALWQLWRSGKLLRGDLVALSAFGGGLTLGSALITW